MKSALGGSEGRADSWQGQRDGRVRVVWWRGGSTAKGERRESKGRLKGKRREGRLMGLLGGLKGNMLMWGNL